MTLAPEVSPICCLVRLSARSGCASCRSGKRRKHTPIPPSLTTPDSVETSIGTLKFRDGIPDAATAAKIYDQLDLQRGVDAFLNGLQGVSIYAARQGILDAGVKDNEGVLIFSGLMDSQSLFLTANADTVYFLGIIDLSKGPMVVETPPRRARHLRRHVVPLDHRLRRARARPRRGRQVPPAAAGLRRAAARGRLFHRRTRRRPASRCSGRAVPREQRSRSPPSRRSSRR